MKTKWCNKCKNNKSVNDFNKNRSSKTGLSDWCRECNIKNGRRYRLIEENKQKARDQRKIYFTNSENRKRRVEAVKRYGKTKKGKISRNRYLDNKRKIDPLFRIKHSLRSQLLRALNGISKSKHTLELLGCNYNDFIKYLENQFVNGMTWKNYGSGEGKWNIDHKIPCRAFNLLSEEEQKKCFHYSNLQPLWSIDNFIKGDKLPDGLRARDVKQNEEISIEPNYIDYS